MSYKVKFKVPFRELGKSDVEFQIRKDGAQFGTLRISRGALVWFPKGTNYGHTVPWEGFHKDAVKYRRYERRSRATREATE